MADAALVDVVPPPPSLTNIVIVEAADFRPLDYLVPVYDEAAGAAHAGIGNSIQQYVIMCIKHLQQDAEPPGVRGAAV